jgi:hypothetical protein
MSRVIANALVLMGIYLLVMTSAKPGDAIAGFVLGLVLAVALRPRLPGRRPAPALAAPARRVRPGCWSTTAVEMARGSGRTARSLASAGACGPASSRFPAEAGARRAVALWGVVTGEGRPTRCQVDVDEERDVLIVHLVDASDPDTVRERHRLALRARQRKGVA